MTWASPGFWTTIALLDDMIDCRREESRLEMDNSMHEEVRPGDYIFIRSNLKHKETKGLQVPWNKNKDPNWPIIPPQRQIGAFIMGREMRK
jgi:hypothetical protein